MKKKFNWRGYNTGAKVLMDGCILVMEERDEE